nr:RecX family transcriptional regulator [Candidatus Gracilibacteria bacterium]
MLFETLRDYAINYYLKYYPSTKKLKEKLLKKSLNDEKLSLFVIKSLESIIVEKQVIESKIRFYISRNKNLSYIKSKLFEKGFEKDDYEKILEEKFNLNETLLNKEFIKRKVLDYKSKGKSRNYIFQKLFGRSEDKGIINEILDEYFLEDDELINIKFEYEKIKGKYEKNKLVERLLRKGFYYDDIKKIVI